MDFPKALSPRKRWTRETANDADREKVMRGLKRTDTPILKGVQIYHNFSKPHMGRTGSGGDSGKGENKWITIIQNAATL